MPKSFRPYDGDLKKRFDCEFVFTRFFRQCFASQGLRCKVGRRRSRVFARHGECPSRVVVSGFVVLDIPSVNNISTHNESSLYGNKRVAVNLVGIDHRPQLEEVYGSNSERNEKAIQSNIEWVRLANFIPLHRLLRIFLESIVCIVWLIFCLLLAQFNVNCSGGRHIVGFLVSLVLLAVSSAQCVNSLLRLADLLEAISVTQKHLTNNDYCNTVLCMANVLSKDKQIAIIGALAEGSSIRSIERLSGFTAIRSCA
jgi:hypothetical protein